MLMVLAGRLPKAFRKVQRFRKGVEPVVESPVFDPSHVHEELYKTRGLTLRRKEDQEVIQTPPLPVDKGGITCSFGGIR